jgi:hypothetical protein
VLSGLGLGVATSLTSCSSTSDAPQASQSLVRHPAKAANKDAAQAGGLARVKLAIAMAKEIVAADANPFRLPDQVIAKIDEVAAANKKPGATSDAAGAQAAAADPTAGVQLQGIIYSPKRSTALLSANSQTFMVEQGQTISIDGAMYKVRHIDREKVELSDVNNPKRAQILNLQDIIGLPSSGGTPSATPAPPLSGLGSEPVIPGVTS